jgi:uncharacterized protein
MTPVMTILLVAIALAGGACITTIGPGGIFVTIALFALADLSPGTVAGTASVTFIATGIVGSWAYMSSGEFDAPGSWRSAVVLSVASVMGAFAGSQLNALLDSPLFGALLGGFVLLTGPIILLRQRLEPARGARFELDGAKAVMTMAGVGVAVGLPGGLLGVGGPVLAVPLLVILGVPMLVGVALAQVQSIFIASFATFGYALQGVIDWRLAALLSVPLLIGTVAGWYLARRIDPGHLKVSLAVVMVALGSYLLVGSL